MRRKVFGIATALFVASGLVAHAAQACATAPPREAFVRVADESAVVVWDAKAKREHFVRRASFRSTTKDFGFLVPTPTKPELAEIDDGVFDALAWATRPRVEERHERSGVTVGSFLFTTLSRSAPAEASAVAAAPVRVLDEVQVAGYEAVVLEADDPKALATWLADHGYDARPALASWLEPYVAQKWKITAFKVASPKGTAPSGTLGSKTVRMSFDTERPFFPYREPADQREPGPAGAPPTDASRQLLVYVVSNERVSAQVGSTGAFPGSIPFAKHVGAELPGEIAKLMPEKSPFVTVVLDPSSPRPGTDELYFDRSGEQGEVEPPPVIQVVKEPFFIPIEGLVLVAGFGAVLVAVVRKGRRENAA